MSRTFEPLQVQIASSFFSRTRGLIAMSPLKPNTAMLLRPCNSVHTGLMRYTIDVIFLSRQNEVMKIESSLKPWRISYCAGATSVLELAKGEAEKRAIRVGLNLTSLLDHLEIETYPRS
jgi:uncharacterized protein